MVITGSAILIEPGSDHAVLERLKEFPQVTYHVKSESGTDLVVNLEAEDHQELEDLCARLLEEIPQIVDITHVYVNFEEEVEKMVPGTSDREPHEKA
jgi:nitrate reductase NapAB chaperone NapD